MGRGDEAVRSRGRRRLFSVAWPSPVCCAKPDHRRVMQVMRTIPVEPPVTLWIGSKRRARGVGVVATKLLVLAVLLLGGSLSPPAAQAADPASAVWNVDPGDAAHIQAAI